MLLLALGTVSLAADTKVETPADCKQCGMNRTAFGHSRMVVTYKDGSSSGTCSINCVVVDMKKQPGKEVKSFQVGDYNSKKLIDAKSAVWGIGGKKKGVMTPVSKWAFADKKAADAFVKENGGKLATFGEVLAATEKELAEEDQHKGHDHKGHDHKEHGEHKM
jgi:nitrous oxide reductase accessory protein NosL